MNSKLSFITLWLLVFGYVFWPRYDQATQLSPPSSNAVNAWPFSYTNPIGDFIMYWTFPSFNTITIQFSLNGSAFAGLGFGANMRNSDMVIGWLNADGSANVTDYWSVGHLGPRQDISLGGQMNLQNTSVTTVDGRTTVTFTRELNTNDPYDAVIVRGQMNLIYAWKDGPLGSGLSYHGPENHNQIEVDLSGGGGTGKRYSYNYTNELGNFTMFWDFPTQDSIEMKFQMTATQYIAIGFGDSMMNSDMIIGWMNLDGSWNVTDYWSTGHSAPQPDIRLGGFDDLENASVATENGETWIYYRRLLDTGDKCCDKVIVQGPMNLIYAFGGNSADIPGLVYHHHNRNQVSVNMAGGALTPNNTCVVSSDVGTFTFEWSFAPNDMIDFTFSIGVPAQSYIGLGFGTNMQNTAMVVGWIDEDGSPNINPYWGGTGHDVPTLTTSMPGGENMISQTNISVINGVTRVSFRRPMVIGQQYYPDLTRGLTNLIYAWRDGYPPQFQFHGFANFNKIQADLSLNCTSVQPQTSSTGPSSASSISSSSSIPSSGLSGSTFSSSSTPPMLASSSLILSTSSPYTSSGLPFFSSASAASSSSSGSDGQGSNDQSDHSIVAVAAVSAIIGAFVALFVVCTCYVCYNRRRPRPSHNLQDTEAYFEAPRVIALHQSLLPTKSHQQSTTANKRPQVQSSSSRRNISRNVVDDDDEEETQFKEFEPDVDQPELNLIDEDEDAEAEAGP